MDDLAEKYHRRDVKRKRTIGYLLIRRLDRQIMGRHYYRYLAKYHDFIRHRHR